ncbi:MAG TPA: hypothetical protein VI451_07665 [Anaerolineales bacterium]|nr:hypothetical protein [Anaerolineales bacterium]
MLQVYLASHCLTYDRTTALLTFLRLNRPLVPVQVINLDDSNVQIPDYVFGSPIYVWDDQIVSLGNPSEEELLKIADGQLPHFPQRNG